jgi:N utilization substance protein B
MVLPIQKLRELVFHFLYCRDFDSSNEDIIPFLMEHHKVTKKSLYLVQEFADQVVAKQKEIDEQIQTHSIDYEFHRIPRVEKNLLRLGVFEMMHNEKTPPKVAIAETLRLARKFTTKEGAQFVNAVLDAIFV